MPTDETPFRIVIPPAASIARRMAITAVRPLLSWALALPTYRALYRRVRTLPGTSLSARALQALDIGVDTAGTGWHVPPSGPLIVIANHPHGIVDGLALSDAVGRHRTDVRVLTTRLLAQIPDLSELCLFVDAVGGRGAVARSLPGLRAALRWLRDGRALIVFPAGGVAHTSWQTSTTPLDSPWHATVGRLALGTGATVVPAFITGRNSHWFYRAGQVHETLRTLLLARELLGQRGRRLAVRFGAPISLAGADSHPREGAAATTLMRAAVDRLGQHAGVPAAQTHVPTIEAVAPAELAAEVQRLYAGERLLQSGRFEVFCVPASRIPSALREIGRLRELTFRGVGEGTGRELDLDRFDQHYLHLFVWNREAREIVAAYRLGPVDQVLAAHGIDGLYTSTLFRYDQRFLSRLGPAIELGRSFVRAEYQRSSNALLLLWKGVARFVTRSPRYRVLFGPVSISSRYSDMSQHLLRAFLAQNARHHDLAALVGAVTDPGPLRLPPGLGDGPSRDLQALDRLIAGRESDGKGIPVLLRQYLRLNAKLLGFNLDPAFGDALDALMMVDLADVDRVILSRYFGADEAARLLSLRTDSPRQAAAPAA